MHQDDEKRMMLEDIKSLKRKLKLRDTKIRKLNHEVRGLNAQLESIKGVGIAAKDLYETMKCSNFFEDDF